MVGNHPHGCIGPRICAEPPAGYPGDPLDQAGKDIGIVVARLALGHGCYTLKPHTGIDAGFRQTGKGAALIPVELHKDQIPNLEKTVAVAVDPAIRSAAADLWSLINMDLRARPARPGIPHGPKIVLLAQTDNPARQQIVDPLPDAIGLVIILKNRYP